MTAFIPAQPISTSVQSFILTTQTFADNISHEGKIRELNIPVTFIRELNANLEALIEQIEHMSVEEALDLLNHISFLEPDFVKFLRFVRSNYPKPDASEFEHESYKLVENLADLWLELQVSADPQSLDIDSDDMEKIIDHLANSFPSAQGRGGENSKSMFTS